jgi:hypothetical protein
LRAEENNPNKCNAKLSMMGLEEDGHCRNGFSVTELNHSASLSSADFCFFDQAGESEREAENRSPCVIKPI